MGQCAVAWEQFKERRADVKRKKVDDVIDEMIASLKEEKDRFVLKEKEFEGLSKGTDEKIAEVLKAARTGKIKQEQARSFLISLKKRRKRQEEQRQKYVNMQDQVEASELRLNEMRTNTGLMKHHDKLVKGYSKLRKAGLDVGVAESKLDNVDETLESIAQFNDAFKAQEEAVVELSEKELAEIEAEVDADLQGGLEERLATTMPALKVKVLTPESKRSDEVELEDLALDMA